MVTGKRYEKVEDIFYDPKHFSDKLILFPVKEIPSGQVVKILKGLSESEIDKYVQKLHDLEGAIFLGYQKDMIMIRNDNNQLNSDESYIRNFRRRYGK